MNNKHILIVFIICGFIIQIFGYNSRGLKIWPTDERFHNKSGAEINFTLSSDSDNFYAYFYFLIFIFTSIFYNYIIFY